jgi:hypothetical protein
MLVVLIAVFVLLLPLGMTALHATFVWKEVRSRALYVILSGLVQYALLCVVFWFTIGQMLTSVGIAGGAPKPGSEGEWLTGTLTGMTGLMVAVYILAGWLIQRALSNAMHRKSDGGGAA